MEEHNINAQAEEVDDNSDSNNSKRKSAIPHDEQEHMHKKVKTDLYKPPTVEELNDLKEAETMFHSSLFRLQIDEFMGEVKSQMKLKQKLQAWIESLKVFLKSIPSADEYEIKDNSWINKKEIKVPLIRRPKSVKGSFKFLPPSDIEEIGSYALDTMCSPQPVVDIALRIPKAFWQKTDFLNHIYHRKRALYLTYLAQALRSSDLVQDMKFSYHNNCHLKPVLLLYPNGAIGKHFTVCIFPYPENGTFKHGRFIPERNNVRPSWFFQEKDEDTSTATPNYNASIIADILMSDVNSFLKEKISSQNVKDGIILLKAWALKRGLSQEYTAFNGFIISMIVSYLLAKRKISPLMSSYQVFRIALLTLKKENWAEQGVSLCQDQKENQPSLEDFQKYFEVVFIDPSGFLNVCSTITKEAITMLRHEAELALKILDSSSSDSFGLLFIQNVPFCRKFEFLIHFSDSQKFTEYSSFLNAKSEMLDHGGNAISSVIPKMCQFLKKGLGDRINLIDVKVCSNSNGDNLTWPLCKKPPDANHSKQITLGILLNQEFVFSNLEKGPVADDPEAKEFRDFWGEKSDLRRFQDGSIREAVLWPAETIDDKRNVLPDMIKHILKRHVGVNPEDIHCTGTDVHCTLVIPKEMFPPTAAGYGTGEEAVVNLMQSFNSLTKQLRNLDDLPLVISSVQGISPVFRFCEVFPPFPKLHPSSKKKGALSGQSIIIKETAEKCPAWVQPLEVIIRLGGSGKWPDDVDAIKRVKTAFHLKIAEAIQSQCSLITVASPSHIDVLKDGYVFRLKLACHKELSLLKKKVETPEGPVFEDTKESKDLESPTVIIPKLNSTLHGLHQQHNTYGTACRLAKRWISSQLMHGYIKDITVEIIMSYIYIRPEPFTSPSSPQVAFLRFLALLNNHDWGTMPLIVNLNNELKKEEIATVESIFNSQRANLPPMVIVTPFDKNGKWFTRKTPTAILLKRLLSVANASLATLEKQLYQPQASDFKLIFRPPLNAYDVLIHLDPVQIPTHGFAVDRPEGTLLSYKPYFKRNNEKMPVIGYDPVESYLQDLRETFEEFALFFYDVYGGDFIAVAWKPDAFTPKPFKVSNVNSCMISSLTTDGTANIAPNVEAILEDFSLLGTGLVKTIENRTENWKIA